jgi:hypothetical protein
MSGVAVNIRRQSRAYAWYNVYVVASYYITYFAVFLDYIRIRNDFEESMKNVRMIFGMGLVAWMHLSIRYLFQITVPGKYPSTGAVMRFQMS